MRSERLRNERLRLLYVAVTRARFRLYLSGHAPPDKEGEPKPAARSLLSLLWPAIREEFPAVVATDLLEGCRACSAKDGVASPCPRGFELPVAALAPVVHSLARAQAEERDEPEYSWVGPLARAAGTVLHAELERLALLGEAAIADLPARVAACAAGLREHGIADEVALRMAREILQRLDTLVREERARWLLFTPQRQAASELRLSGIVAGELRNVVIDRSFIDAEGTRWIVDYKTGRHAGGGLEEFISSELQRYAPQLRLYRELLRGLGPEPVRAALYFPGWESSASWRCRINPGCR